MVLPRYLLHAAAAAANLHQVGASFHFKYRSVFGVPEMFKDCENLMWSPYGSRSTAEDFVPQIRLEGLGIEPPPPMKVCMFPLRKVGSFPSEMSRYSMKVPLNYAT